MRRAALIGVAIIVVGFIALQLVPGFAHTNPSPTFQVKWSSADGEKLARAACYDCHSYETTWPWYSSVAPMSWLVVHDVNEGREKMNFSTGHVEADELIEQIQRGSMPPKSYLLLHPDWNLTAEQKTALIDAIRTTFGAGEGGASPEGQNGGEGEESGG
jgi:hypothetical protein